MSIFNPAVLRKEIRDSVNYGVFARGERYFQIGRVGALSIRTNDKEVVVDSRVRGTRRYETSLMIDAQTSGLSGYDCSCPYGNEYVCKHIVALAEAYADHYRRTPAQAIPAPEEKTDPLADMRARLAVAGIDTTLLADNVIAQLAAAAKPPPPVPAVEKKQQPPKPQKPRLPFEQRYHLSISTSNGSIYNASVAKNTSHKYWYETHVTMREIMEKEKELTEPQRELLEILRVREQSPYEEQKKIDLTRVFALAREAGLLVRDNASYGNARDLAWAEPRRTSAVLSKNTRESVHGNHEYDVITLNISPTDMSDVQGVASGENGLLIVRKNTVEITPLPLLLAHILERAYSPSDYDAYNRYIGDTQKKGTTDMLDGEYEHINEIIAESTAHLDCEMRIEPSYAIERYEPKPIIVVDYDMKANTLAVLPSVDYGGVVLPVCDTTHLSTAGHKLSVLRRHDPAFGITTVTRPLGATIHITPVVEKLERTLFTLAETHGEKLGLTSKGRATVRGERGIAQFADRNLPHLKALGYEMRYPHDMLDITPSEFRTSFDIDFNAENDWLAFDIELYCGDNRVQLSDIEAFIESGDTLFKTSDGRVLRITNHEAIERLIELLAHFRKNDAGRYEGRAYHAPELDAMTKGSPHYSARVSKAFDSFVSEVRQGKLVKSVRIPKPFSSTLREYQSAGVHWLTFLHKYKFAGVLADDMGLGKTLQALAALSMHAQENKPSLVVAPKTLLHNWAEEAGRFAPHLKTLVVDGPQAEREALVKDIKKHDLVITSYPSLQKDIEMYEKRKVHFNYCVLDEAQYIKNPRTKNAHAARRIKSDHRLALTGTPLENSVEEVWSQFDFLMPGFLGHHAHFQKHFGHPIMKRSDAHALTRLKTKVTPFMLRRTKGEVLPELPPKIEQVITCALSDEQNLLYQDVLKRVRNDITSAVKSKGFAASQIHILAGLTRLRQICNHPALVLPPKKRGVYPSAKLDECMEIIERMRSEKRKTLVFSQFTGMLDILERELAKRKIAHAYLSGKTRNRKEVIESFTKDPDTAVFLISTKAGGVGLNLVAADCVVIFDPWWNPSVERQAVDRTHRIGQTRTVHVYRLRTKGTIEEKIAVLQERKQKLFDALVGESKDLFKKLAWEDVRGLLGA
ncbi:MAG: DEAD/DEAH box helicase [Patescibacteria group bacterium]